MTEEQVEKADEIRQGLKEDGIVKPEPYEKPLQRWYDDLVKDIDEGDV